MEVKAMEVHGGKRQIKMGASHKLQEFPGGLAG